MFRWNLSLAKWPNPATLQVGQANYSSIWWNVCKLYTMSIHMCLYMVCMFTNTATVSKLCISHLVTRARDSVARSPGFAAASESKVRKFIKPIKELESTDTERFPHCQLSMEYTTPLLQYLYTVYFVYWICPFMSWARIGSNKWTGKLGTPVMDKPSVSISIPNASRIVRVHQDRHDRPSLFLDTFLRTINHRSGHRLLQWPSPKPLGSIVVVCGCLRTKTPALILFGTWHTTCPNRVLQCWRTQGALVCWLLSTPWFHTHIHKSSATLRDFKVWIHRATPRCWSVLAC